LDATINPQVIRQAYYWALRITRRTDLAEEAVQETWLRLQRASEPNSRKNESDITHFFNAVRCTALNLIDSEKARNKREAVVSEEHKMRRETSENMNAPDQRMEIKELNIAARAALNRLPLDLRLAVTLCCEQGFTQTQASAILSVSQQTVAWRVEKGLAYLRKELEAAGFTEAAPAALATALGLLDLPAVPASLSTLSALCRHGNGVLAGAKTEGMAMTSKMLIGSVLLSVGAATGWISYQHLADGTNAPPAVAAFGEMAPTGSENPPQAETPAAPAPAVATNPVTGRQEREEVFEFAEKPKVAKQGDKTVIAFASKGKCDATVAIVDGQGKVVRHLASGVLGANAPWPFQQNSLAQKIEWDGKDNRGKPAPAGCKVKVSLGLKLEVDRDLFQYNERCLVSGMAVDAQGFLYTVSGGPVIQVFARDGSYQRTLYPRPARANGGLKLKVSEYMEADAHITAAPPRQSPQLTRDGRLLWVTGGAMDSTKGSPGANGKIRHRRLLVTDTRSGDLLRVENVCESVSPRGSRGGPQGTMGGGGGVEMGLSPDDKWLYFGTACRSSNPGRFSLVQKELPHYLQWQEGSSFVPNENHHAVSRTSVENPGLTEAVLGEVRKPGNDNAHFNWPRGVAFDAKGNLYVCDHLNDRVQIFGPAPEHKYLKTIPIERPDQIAVHPKTGAIYVLCTKIDLDGYPSSGAALRGGTTRVVKMGSLDAPSVMAEIAGRILGPRGMRGSRDDPKNFDGYVATGFALDSTSNPPAVWVASFPQGVVRFDDMGTEFKKGPAVSLGTMGAPPPEIDGKRLQCGASNTSMYVTADPYREEIYVREANGNYGTSIVRLNGRTGEAIERLNIPAWESYLGPDGILYGRCVTWGSPHWLWRYDPDARKFLLFPEADLQLAEIPANGGKFPPGPVFEPGAAKFQYAIGGVAPNGDLYVPHTPAGPNILSRLAQTGVKGDVPDEAPLLAVFSSTGKLKTLHALDGFIRMHGLPCYRIGPSGAVYMSLHYKPVGQERPHGFDPAQHKDSKHWGSIVKFNSRFGEFPVGRIRQQSHSAKDDLGGKPTHVSQRSGVLRAENMAWTFGGMSFLTQEGCRCRRASFDVDRFERVFLPKHITHSVDILDANGNVIARAGERGNIDNRGRESLVKDPKTGILRQREPNDPQNIESPFAKPSLTFIEPQHLGVTDEALYVMDSEAKRLRRVALGYHAEETVPAP
jgi:RNA polymerase sigma factor (sigma-70 family)